MLTIHRSVVRFVAVADSHLGALLEADGIRRNFAVLFYCAILVLCLQIQASAGTAPVAPPLYSSVSGTSVTLWWTPQVGATSYNVYRGLTTGGESATPIVSGTTADTYVDTGLAAGTEYFYEVIAVNAYGSSPYSAESPEVTIPIAPPNVTIGPEHSMTSLNWGASANGGQTYYNVYRGISPGGESATPVIANTLWQGAYDSTVLGGTTYYYVVKALNGAGMSGSSAEVSTTPMYNFLGTLTGLAATPGNSQITLAWTPQAGATSYNVYRSTVSGHEILVHSNLTSASIVDTGLTNNVTYYYFAIGLNGAGGGYGSSEVSATPEPQYPNTPTTLAAATANDQVDLSWTATTGAASYNIYRSATSGGEGTTPIAANVAGTGSTVTYNDTSVTSGTYYYYQVAAVNTSGTSGCSNEAGAVAGGTSPTIEIAATATPSPVVGKTVNLSALGADNGGAANLTYTWAATAASPGTAAFSVNGNNAAQNTTATLTAAGTYTFQVTITDPSGLSTTSSVSVFVSQTITSIAITPASVSLISGGSQQYTAISEDQFAAPLALQQAITWSLATGAVGTISATGLYDAPIAGGGTDTVNATSGLVTGSATVNLGPPPPAAPTGLAAVPGDAQVALTWNAATGATSYNLYQAIGSGALALYQQGLTATSFTDHGVTNGTSYSYAVEAVNSGGSSVNSNVVAVTPEPPAPAALASLTATAGDKQVDLYWQPSSGAASYSVYKGTSAAGESSTPVATGITGVSYADPAVTDGTTYYYYVTATNGGGISPNSNEANATPTAGLVNAPTNVTAVPGDTTVALVWTGVTGATYNIYRFDSDGTTVASPYQAGVSVAGFNDTGLTDGTTYTYTVTAVISGVEGPTSNEAFATPEPPAPPAPTGLTATAGNTQTLLSWVGPASADSYNIYRSASQGGEGSTPYETGVTDTTFTDSGLTNGTIYYYAVTAVGDGGEGAQSNEASAAPTASVLWAPVGLTATPGGGVVYLNWIPSDGASTYGIYRGTASGAETLYQSGISSISYNDIGATNGTTYYYKVVAVSGSVTSPASNESSATPEPVPNPPTGLSAAAGVLQIVLSWTSPTPTPNTYNIYRGTASGQEGGVPVATGVAAATYIDTDPTLDPSQTYYYEVTSLLNGVEGVPSNEAFAAPTAPAPAAPVIDEAISEGGQVTLGWQPSTYAASYSVFRGITASGEGSTPIASGITGNSYTDTGLTGGTAYYYTVAAVGSGGSAVSQQCMAIPYTAPTNLSAAAGDQEVLLTWAPITGASSNGGGYIVSRSVTAGGPYEQIPGPPITGGTAYLDTDVDNGLTTGTTYYYVVQYVDSHGYASSESSELAVTTIQAAGTWTVNLTPAGASSGLTTGTNCSSVGTNSNTEITVEALANGPQSAAVTQTGTASCSGTWSIMWTPNTPTSYPGLLVLTEDQYQALSDQVAGSLTGSASVSVAGGYSLTVDDPSTVTALIDSPVTSHTIDTSTTGIVNFLTASTDHSVTVQSNQIAGVTAGYSESQSTCTHIIHVYTPAYFAQNYTDPTNITLTFNTTPQSATATAQLPAGAPASASIAVSGDIGDEFSCYTPGAN